MTFFCFLKRLGDSYVFTKDGSRYQKDATYNSPKHTGWKIRCEKVDNGTKLTRIA